jgi:hypothetical protein
MGLTRRVLFQTAAAATAGNSLPAQTRPAYDMRSALQPPRVTNAMWDYSWIKSHYPGGPFEDWDKTTDQLLERRFNTVRIDAFPGTIGNLKSLDDEVTLPAAALANWGFSDRDRPHRIARDLVEFVRIAKRKRLKVILSTWNSFRNDDPELLKRMAADRNLYRRAWSRTLDLLGDHDLLDTVLYVDLDQEFPYFSPYAAELRTLRTAAKPASTSLQSAMEEAGQAAQGLARSAWTPSQMQYVEKLFREMLPFFQSKYPALRFTYSLTGYFQEVRAMRLQLFDVLELHLWIHSPRFDNRTGFNTLPKDRGPHDYKDYAARLRKTMASVRPMLVQEMHNRLAQAMDWSREIAAPLVTTEAWGPWWHMDHPDLDWQWLKDWCEMSMGLAGQYGLWGSTPWNYAHPYWKNWSEVAWYRRVNEKFLKS